MKLQVKNLSKIYKFRKHFCKKQENFVLFSNINFEINLGQNLLITGKSGSGKTTIAKILCFLEPFDSGQILIDDKKLNIIKNKRQIIQYIFSDAKLCLNPRRKIHNLIKDIFINFKIQYDFFIIKDFFDILELDIDLLDAYPHTLSMGEAMRINIIRALLIKPKFIILDEPFACLDILSAKRLCAYLKTIQNKLKISFIFISHQKYLLKEFDFKILKL